MQNACRILQAFFYYIRPQSNQPYLMKKLYAIAITLIAFISFQSCMQIEETQNPGKKIGTIKNGQYVITVDTVALKSYWERTILKKPEIKLSKIEIVKGKVVGKKNEDYYMLTGYVENKNARTARWLVKNGNDFYFHKMLDKTFENEEFYSTYYFAECTDSLPTVPMALNLGNGYEWSISENPATSSNSSCKVRKSLRYEEDLEF